LCLIKHSTFFTGLVGMKIPKLHGINFRFFEGKEKALQMNLICLQKARDFLGQINYGKPEGLIQSVPLLGTS
ncbi:MAG: hypothetical protein O9252_00830, partial [Algoriphagus sp.]|nr:hypothetical protein [Algoriphagus sp.]